MNAKEEFDHVAFMRDEYSWPHWPVLPVKTRIPGKFPAIGVILAEQGAVVYEVSMFEVTQKNLQSCKVSRYESFEELHDDGWVVD